MSCKEWKKLSSKEQKEFITRAIVHLKVQLEEAVSSSGEDSSSSSDEEQPEASPAPLKGKLRAQRRYQPHVTPHPETSQHLSLLHCKSRRKKSLS